MPSISNYVAAPYQGVSQVPAPVRVPEACEAMTDCLVTIPNGIEKRPPWRYLGTIISDGTADPYAYTELIMRGDYATDTVLYLNIHSGVVTPRLFLLSTPATPITPTVSSAAQTYLNLNGPRPNRDFRCTTVEDVTFISNRTSQVANAATTQALRPHEALVWIKTGQYGRTYTITVNGAATGNTAVTILYQCGNGNNPSDAQGVGTEKIANALGLGIMDAGATFVRFVDINGGTTFPGAGLNDATAGLPHYGFTFAVHGSILYLSHPTLDFTVLGHDDQGGFAMEVIKGSVQAFSDLPALAVQGFTVEISQDQAGGKGSYWVQFNATSGDTTGVWQEVPQPGALLGLDATTMPIALKDTLGSWAADTAAWTQRTTGNPTFVPDPGFVGDYITDITWISGRLGLLYNGGLVLSGSDSPYKFYTTTLTVDLESDPVGFLPPDKAKVQFKQCDIFDQRLFCFADKCQGVIVTTGATLDSQQAAMKLIAKSPFTDLSRVQQGNHKVYFLVNRIDGKGRATNAILYQLAIDRLSGLALEEDQSVAVSAYLPATIDRAATWEADFLTVYASSGSNKLYTHVYREKDYQGVQNGFYDWTGPMGMVNSGLFFKDGALFGLFVDPSGNSHLFSWDSQPLQITQGLDSNVSTIAQYLDGMLDDTLALTATYNATTGLTTFALPLAMPPGFSWSVAVRAPFADYPEGYLCTVTSQDATHVSLPGDWRTAPLWFGHIYVAQMQPTEYFAVGQDKRPMHDGRLTLKHLKVEVNRYGTLAVQVNLLGRTSRITRYEGYTLANPETPIGAPPQQETAVVKVPVKAKAHDATLVFLWDTHLGARVTGYEWKADWNPKSRRVT